MEQRLKICGAVFNSIKNLNRHRVITTELFIGAPTVIRCLNTDQDYSDIFEQCLVIKNKAVFVGILCSAQIIGRHIRSQQPEALRNSDEGEPARKYRNSTSGKSRSTWIISLLPADRWLCAHITTSNNTATGTITLTRSASGRRVGWGWVWLKFWPNSKPLPHHGLYTFTILSSIQNISQRQIQGTQKNKTLPHWAAGSLCGSPQGVRLA